MSTFIEVQGEPLAVQVFEPDQHRGDAMLLHGFTGSKEDFVALGPLLCARGYRVIAFDHRGQHESPHSERADAYTIASLARDAIELADHFGLARPHLCGHSFGGLVAQRAVVMRPYGWASLTLVCSGPQGRPESTDLRHTIDILSKGSMQRAWDLERDADARRQARYALLKRRWLASDPRSVITHAEHLLSEPSIVDEVRDTAIPSLVAYGEYDDAWPLAMQDEMARDLGASIAVIPGAGHAPNEDRPAYTAELLADFWSSVPMGERR